MGLALGMVLKFFTSVEKGLELKVRKFWGLLPTIVEDTGEKPKLKIRTAMNAKLQCLLFVLTRSYIYYIIFMTVPLRS